jgi:uncharacterized delta-60 repeat protein
LGYAQVQQVWVSRYNGPGNYLDKSTSLAIDGSGNVYVTGYSYGSGTDYDYATIKYNNSGVQQWAARYNGPGNNDDRTYSIAVDGSGNVYVTGSSVGSGIDLDYTTIKYNSAGVQQWVARYNGPGNGNDRAYSLAVDGSGNVYVTGESIGSGTSYDYATIKYNSSGVQQWAVRYNGPGNSIDRGYSLAVDISGNVCVTGTSTGNGTNYDYATIKYNSSGVQQWAVRYNGPGNNEDIAASLAVDIVGNVYLTGYSRSGSGIGTEDYATIKYNSAGVQQWVARYNGTGNNDDRANSLVYDSYGNVYVTGQSIGSGVGYDYATIKYNNSGVQQWVARYNGPGNGYDYAYSIAIDGSGNIYVTGESPEIVTNSDYATIKYNNSGVQQWAARYNGPGNSDDVARSLAVDGSGNVYVTGYSRSGLNFGTEDYATIKYSQPVGITQILNEIPKEFALSQNYPNPFNPVTNIKFALPTSSFAKLVVFDVLGREVANLVNEQLKPGIYEVDFDGTNFPSGVYFYKLTSENFSQTRKMILVK